jgi:hypothetical protein
MNSRIERNTWEQSNYRNYDNDRDIVIIYKKDWFEKFLDFVILLTKIARFMCVIIYIFAFIYIKLSGNTNA